MTEQQEAAMRQALKRAFQLGQNYWSWADSEYSSHWKKADAAKAEFDQLVEDTLRQALEQQPASQRSENTAWVEPVAVTPTMVQAFLNACNRHYPWSGSDPAIEDGIRAAIEAKLKEKNT